mgnify:CR=1 FL=1
MGIAIIYFNNISADYINKMLVLCSEIEPAFSVFEVEGNINGLIVKLTFKNELLISYNNRFIVAVSESRISLVDTSEFHNMAVKCGVYSFELFEAYTRS